MASFSTFAGTVVVRALLLIAITSATITVSPLAHAGSASPSAAAKATANRASERGKKLYADGKFDEAKTAFQESFDSVPDPRTLLFLARVERDNGELLLSHASYKKARELAEAGEAQGQAQRATLGEIESELRELDGVLGFITVKLSHAPPGTRVDIDGNDVTAEVGSPIRAEPGPLVVTATTPDGMEKRQNAMIKAGQTSSVAIAFNYYPKADAAVAAAPQEKKAPPAEERVAAAAPKKEPEAARKQPPSTKKTLTWVAGGVGLVGVATFVVFGSLSASKFKNLEDACPQNHCDPNLENDKNTGKTFQTVANVGLVTGAVGIASAITLFAIGGGSEAAHGDQPAHAKLELGLGRVALSGSFQ